MGFLDSTGLAYYTNKLKSIFIRSVNGQGPIGDQGNVEITQVPLAENLYNDEIKDNPSEFIYRISGGLADIESGDAALTTIRGISNITGRINESISFDNTNNINLTCTSLPTFRTNQFIGGQTGDYTFLYATPTFPNESQENSWQSVGTWQFNNQPILSLSDDFGLSASGIVNKGIFTSASNTITQVNINPHSFNTHFSESGNYQFTCQGYLPGEGQPIVYKWYYQGVEISLAEYGITIQGTETDDAFIIVILQLGTPTSNCIVHYQAYVNGSYTFSTPTAFESTNFNQFNKNSTNDLNVENSGYLTGATINSSTHTIIEQQGSYVCYCKAAYGSPAGYLAYSNNGYITGIGWCKNPPAIDTELSGTETTYDSDMGFSDATKHRAIMFEEDGYVVVSVTNMSDLCIHLRWDKEEDDVFEDYIAPDIIDFTHLRGTYENIQQTLPISSYGLPAITVNNQIIADDLDLRTRVYTQNIERLINNETNMTEIINSERPYEYTDEYIYAVLETPRSYINVETLNAENEWEPIRYVYTVNDLGTEEFRGTSLDVYAIQRYGENLRNKLKGNVLTINTQYLEDPQISSVRKNFLDIIYPVGSIYISTSSTSPQEIWGGAWTQISGRFLLAASTTYTAGSTGGASSVTLTVDQMPSHTHIQEAHNHSMNNIWSNGSGSNYAYISTSNRTLSTRYTASTTATNKSTGGGKSHNNMPPYLAVYMWKRTE